MPVSHMILIGGLIVFAHGTMTAAQTTTAQSGAVAAGNPLVPKGKNPFAGIFKSRRGMALPSGELKGGDAAQPRIVCGMVVVPVDPSTDPKIVVQPKPGAQMDYKMPRIVPQVCRE
jgi:hypothetical protein